MVFFPAIVEFATGLENDGFGGPELALEDVVVVEVAVLVEVEVEE